MSQGREATAQMCRGVVMSASLHPNPVVILTREQLLGKVCSCIRCGTGRYAEILTMMAVDMVNYVEANRGSVKTSPSELLLKMMCELDQLGLIQYSYSRSKWEMVV